MTPQAEALILENMDLVEKVALRVARKMPVWIEMSELVSLGNVGLVEAASRFDPSRHASFRVFAMLRIRGAMIDAYRGKNYPRLMEQMPEAWLQGSQDDEDLQPVGRTPGRLIDASLSVLDLLIAEQESVVVSIDAVRARSRLNRVQGRVLDRHINGETMGDIARRHGRSRAWAMYTVAEAKQKLRAALLDLEDEAA